MKRALLSLLLSAAAACAQQPGDIMVTRMNAQGTAHEILWMAPQSGKCVVFGATGLPTMQMPAGAGGPAAAGEITGATLAANVTASSLLSAAGGSFGTAAYTAAAAYATAAQGALAATALQAESDPLLAAHAALSTAAHGGIVASTDPRLTDARTPLAHTQAWGTITSTPTTLAGYGITNAVANTVTVNGFPLSANVTISTITGNAGTATALQTPRAINGVAFDGTAAITVPAPFSAGGNAGTAATPATTGAQTVVMDSAIKTITPTGACTFNASGGVAGQLCTFLVTTSGTTSFVLTWGTNFRTTATLATGTVSARLFAVTFRCTNGTQWVEIARTAAMP